MSLSWARVARVVAPGFSTRHRPRAAAVRFPEPPGPPARDRCGRAWRGSTIAGGPPWRNIARARPILLAAAAFPGTSPTPIKDSSFHHGGDLPWHRDGPCGPPAPSRHPAAHRPHRNGTDEPSNAAYGRGAAQHGAGSVRPLLVSARHWWLPRRCAPAAGRDLMDE